MRPRRQASLGGVRWLPLVLVSALVIAVLVAADPGAVGLSCGPADGGDEWTRVPQEEFIGPCRLRFVIDGDTLELACSGETQRVRLLRIDTPEREQSGHGAARAALRRLAREPELRLLLEVAGQPVRDRHGRLLAYVYSGDRNLNLEMVRLGWSQFDRRFGAGRFGRAFQAAESEARAAGRGLWAESPEAGP